MRQFKIERSDWRFDISLPVKIAATDVNGQPVNQELMNVNVSRRGALLKGVHRKIRVGSQVPLSRLGKLEQFLIVWAGEANTPRAGQVGVSAVDTACSFWNDAIGAPSQAELAGARNSRSEKISAKSTATTSHSLEYRT
jgi:hypothetical protein